MVKTRSSVRKINTDVTEKQSSKEKSILSLENPRAPSETSSETASESSSISRLYTVLNYFSNYCRCSRRNSENTTNFLTSSNSIETESTSSEPKENQIPEERNENISSESSSSKTNSFRRWAHSPVFKFSSILSIGCIGVIGGAAVTFTGFFLYQFRGSTQLDLDLKGDNNLPTAVPLARPASFYELKKVSDTSVHSVGYTVSPSEIQNMQAQKQASDIMNYLMNQLEKIKENTDNFSEISSIVKQLEHRPDNYLKNSLFIAKQFSMFVGITSLLSFIYGYLSGRQPDRSPSTAHNDNDPRHNASYRTVRRQVSEFKLSDDELSCSSTGSASLSPRGVSQATNGIENLMLLTNH